MSGTFSKMLHAVTILWLGGYSSAALGLRRSGCATSARWPAGPKGEGGLDDATGAGGAGGASMKQTSSTVDLSKRQTLFVPVRLLKYCVLPGSCCSAAVLCWPAKDFKSCWAARGLSACGKGIVLLMGRLICT